ncbi:hypothetical protein BDV06DRAFT_181433 [Aspergillus oleicola]
MKSQSFVREPEVKLEPGIKLEVEEPEIVRDRKVEPVVRKKRSFSIALEDEDQENDQKAEKEAQEEAEGDAELLDLLFVRPAKEDGVAYRTRKRHTLQPEDIQRSAEFGIPI